MRGFDTRDDDDELDVKTFMDERLRWSEKADSEWFDREGWSVLTYV